MPGTCWLHSCGCLTPIALTLGLRDLLRWCLNHAGLRHLQQWLLSTYWPSGYKTQPLALKRFEPAIYE